MKIKSFIKLLISLVMLGLVLRFVNLKDLERIIAGIPTHTAVYVVLIFSAGQILSSFKWWLIARSGGIDVPWSTALKAYFIGMFVNCFGFGTVGGDVARGILLADGKKSKTVALASVIADRAQGLAVLSSIALISIAFFGQPLIDQRLVLVLLGLLISVIGVWLFAPSIIFRIIPKGTKLGRIVHQILQVLPRSPGTLFAITVLSTIFHFSQLWLHSVMAEGLGVTLPWPILLTTIPFVNILATLPLSWNGLGVREQSYRFFLFPAVLTNEQAVAFGAMWLFAVAIISSIGGIVSVLTKDFEVIEEEEKRLEASAAAD